MLSIEETSERVFSLYRKRGGEEYIGEPVTQLQHAIQCALQAEHKGASKQVGEAERARERERERERVHGKPRHVTSSDYR